MPNRQDQVIDLTDSFTLAHHGPLTDAVIVLDDTLNGSIALDCVPVGYEAAAAIEVHDTVAENVARPVSSRKKSKAKKKAPLHMSKNKYRHDQIRERSPLTNYIGDCPICLENMGTQPLVSTMCGHVFCQHCLVEALHFEKKCPTCRRPIRGKNAVHPLYIGTKG